ncbi:hypothetical protein D3C80_1895000 [compost metagenome]
MFIVRGGGIKGTQEVGAGALLAMQVTTPHIAHGLVLLTGNHHIATVMLVHQLQGIIDRCLRAD